MKKLFLFVSILFSLNSFGQKATTQTFQTVLTDLKANGGTPGVQAIVSGLTSSNDGNGGVYMWDATSVAADNGFTVIKVNSITTGRWMRVGNSNTIKLSGTASGTLLQTAYVIPYGQTLPFIPITVIPIPRSATAAQPSWISNITNTGFTINFITVPVVGTNNLLLDYVVVKQ